MDNQCLTSRVTLQQGTDGGLASISYHSRMLNDAERKYITYEKGMSYRCFGCEKCGAYLEHKEFEF
jgi:hypothetical protein